MYPVVVRLPQACNVHRLTHFPHLTLQPTDYGRCVVDVQCAERIVRSYVQRYGGEDCNGDGRIECRDHVRLHMRGPGGRRRQEPLGSLSERRLENCLKYRGIT